MLTQARELARDCCRHILRVIRFDICLWKPSFFFLVFVYNGPTLVVVSNVARWSTWARQSLLTTFDTPGICHLHVREDPWPRAVTGSSGTYLWKLSLARSDGWTTLSRLFPDSSAFSSSFHACTHIYTLVCKQASVHTRTHTDLVILIYYGRILSSRINDPRVHKRRNKLIQDLYVCFCCLIVFLPARDETVIVGCFKKTNSACIKRNTSRQNGEKERNTISSLARKIHYDVRILNNTNEQTVYSCAH